MMTRGPWIRFLTKQLVWVTAAIMVGVLVRSGMLCEVDEGPAPEEVPVQHELTWMAWTVISTLLFIMWIMVVAVYKWLFFGLEEVKAFLNTKSAQERDVWLKGAKPDTTFSDWMNSKLEGFRIRHPERSRVQRLYLNINTITIGAILTLCTLIRIQSAIMHVVLSSLVEKAGPKGLYVSFLGYVTVVPLSRLVGRYQTIVVSQLVLRVVLFLCVGSMVRWKKNDTAVRKRLKQSSTRVQKRTKKTK